MYINKRDVEEKENQVITECLSLTREVKVKRKLKSPITKQGLSGIKKAKNKSKRNLNDKIQPALQLISLMLLVYTVKWSMIIVKMKDL